MKKLIIYLSIFTFIYFPAHVAAEEINPPPEPLSTTIESKAISDPLSLPVWSPYAPVDAILVETTSSIARFILPFAAPAAETVKNFITGGSETDLSNIPENADYKAPTELVGYEEVIFDIQFKNTDYTPITTHKLLFIRMPGHLKFVENSLIVNNKPLSHKENKDDFTYIPEKSLLKIDLTDKTPNNLVNLAFNAQILDKKKLENSPYFFVKFVHRPTGTFTEWNPFPFSKKNQNRL